MLLKDEQPGGDYLRNLHSRGWGGSLCIYMCLCGQDFGLECLLLSSQDLSLQSRLLLQRLRVCCGGQQEKQQAEQ